MDSSNEVLQNKVYFRGSLFFFFTLIWKLSNLPLLAGWLLNEISGMKYNELVQ